MAWWEPLLNFGCMEEQDGIPSTPICTHFTIFGSNKSIWTSSCQWLRFSFKMSILTLYNLLWGNLGHFCYWLAKYFYSCCKLYVITFYNLLWGNLGHFCYWLAKYFYYCCKLYVITLYNLLWGNLGHFLNIFYDRIVYYFNV